MYIGNSPANCGNYQAVDDISASFNGTTTSFALTANSQTITPAKSGQLLVSINGVMQEPDDTGTDGFKVSGSNIVFSSAPASGSTFWCVYQGQNVDIGTPSDGTVGTAQMSSAELSLAGGLSLGDNVKAQFGAGNDLQIYHDGSNSYIKDGGTGNLTLLGGQFRLKNPTDAETMIEADVNGAVKLYYDNAEKLATTSTGIESKSSSSTTSARINASDSENRSLFIESPNLNQVAKLGTSGTGNALAIEMNGNERMRIDSSGNVLVGMTSYSASTDGVRLRQDGECNVNRNGTTLFLNRLSTSGEIANLRKDNASVGSMGTTNGLDFYVGCSSTHNSGIRFQYPEIVPTTASGGNLDNTLDWGKSNVRWDDIYATNGTIQTSDRNEKQDIEELSEAEQRVAVACKGLMRKYRWKDAVAEKGDEARIHFGIIAQDLQDAFTAEGLDAHRYAMFISTTWWETQTEVPAVEAVAEELDEDGNVVVEAVEAKDAYTRTDTFDTAEEAPEGATERTRLGVRYPELLAFIISAI